MSTLNQAMVKRRLIGRLLIRNFQYPLRIAQQPKLHFYRLQLFDNMKSLGKPIIVMMKKF